MLTGEPPRGIPVAVHRLGLAGRNDTQVPWLFGGLAES